MPSVRSIRSTVPRCRSLSEANRNSSSDATNPNGLWAEGPDQGADPEDDEDVEEVGPDDVADGDVGLPAEGRQHGDDQLGGGGADGDDGEPDDELGNPEPLCERGGAVGEQAGSGEDETEPDEKQNDIHILILIYTTVP